MHILLFYSSSLDSLELSAAGSLHISNRHKSITRTITVWQDRCEVAYTSSLQYMRYVNQLHRRGIEHYAQPPTNRID